MRKIARTAAVIAAALLTAATVTSVAPAQSAKVDRITQEEMLARALAMEPAASQGGSASIKLNEYPNHYTMVALRTRSGTAEIHEKFADFFLVVRGNATLVTGGSVVDPKTVNPGEIKGTSVRDGVQTSLQKGDVVHIPANVPHQLLLPEGGEFVYFVIKVQEQQ